MCFLNGSEEIVCGKRDEIQLKGFVVDSEDRFEYLERYSDTGAGAGAGAGTSTALHA